MSSRSKAKELSIAGVFAGLMAVGGLITVPFYPVPLTLQTFFLYLNILVLKERASLSQITYLLMGVFGLPVFAGGVGGYAVLIGPTGGFLIGFLFASILSGKLLSKLLPRKYAEILSITVCVVIVFLLGWIWLSYWMGGERYMAFLVGVLQFLPGDILKAALAIGIYKKIRL